ncbi:sensor histidine kinase [Parabacteroides sp. OttesenSCG-928-G07]|nr:sensor histidine kinase [Parabacteroides sp. OttesenSCG-928-G21]MDL2278152.1 sensor histidine kinase [Parabacteroides sp. OttesenSCG-928-G07]
MNDLSFHITDIANNSLRAEASEVDIDIREEGNRVILSITDNGTGMDEETLARARNPFYTSRTTRKVGLGLPFLFQNAEQTGGSVTIDSELGKGTKVTAVFHSDHIDMPPQGDLAGTMALLITGIPQINFVFHYQTGKGTFSISSMEIKDALGDIPISHSQVMLWVKELIQENITAL